MYNRKGRDTDKQRNAQVNRRCGETRVNPLGLRPSPNAHDAILIDRPRKGVLHRKCSYQNMGDSGKAALWRRNLLHSMDGARVGQNRVDRN
jgi:hypothetical protein